MSEPLTEVALFAGIGGISLAAERNGIRLALACEKDAACRKVLAHRFPDAVIHTDVTELTADDLRAAGAVPGRTVVTAGWPCQGNSVAGGRAGMDHEGSGLWSEVARILAEFRPAWFVGENVPGLRDGRCPNDHPPRRDEQGAAMSYTKTFAQYDAWAELPADVPTACEEPQCDEVIPVGEVYYYVTATEENDPYCWRHVRADDGPIHV